MPREAPVTSAMRSANGCGMEEASAETLSSREYSICEMRSAVARPALACVALALFACLGLSASATAAEFASKTTKIVVPFAAGGGTDIIARTLANEMANALGGTMIIENKPGAGTIIGSPTATRCSWPPLRTR